MAVTKVNYGHHPTLTIGEAVAEDAKIVFDGNAQDFHIGLDDTADDLVIGLGSALGTTTHMAFTEAGEITKPLQPAFAARPQDGTTQLNLAINTAVTIVMAQEQFDIGSNFASNTFTAPVTGKYFLSTFLTCTSGDVEDVTIQLGILTSNGHYYESFSTTQWVADSQWCLSLSVVADMDASDTAYISFYQIGGTAQTDVVVAATWFTGCLLA